MNHLDPSDLGATPAKQTVPSTSSTRRHRGGSADPRIPRDAHRSGPADAKQVHTKHYILDTNVLLHDPSCFQRFGDNHVCIPVDVLSELDRFKNEPSERGANARAVHRALTQCFEGEGQSVTGGVATRGGGTLRLVVFDIPEGSRAPSWLARFRGILPDQHQIDHRILACTLMLQRSLSEPVILVSKDLNMQLKARAVGISCEDYRNDKVAASDVNHYNLRHIEVTDNELQRFASSGILAPAAGDAESLHSNEYVLLTTPCGNKMPARFGANSGFQRLRIPKVLDVPGGITIRPLNLGQQCFLDALFDPEISLVTCYGHAGTGKTLLAVAAGLSAVFSDTFRGLTISRPVVAMGDTLGYLPGSLDEKMRPWLQPIYDALDFLMPPRGVASNGNSKKKHSGRKKSTDSVTALGPGARTTRPYDSMIEDGVIEIEALCYIRGRSIPHRFFILDEAQQLTPLEAKTIVTRMSKFSKIILIGDPAQIDNPYVDSRSNGLVYTRDRLKNQSVTAHVSLSKGERSTLAEIGATLM